MWIITNWRKRLFMGISLLAIFALCFYNLAKLTNGYLSYPELKTIESSSSGQLIWDNPLNLPVKIGQYGLIKLGLGSTALFRSVSAIFGVLLVVLFYKLVKLWFSPTIAWLSSALLLTSSLFLHYARLATPDILVPLGFISLMWSGWWVFKSKPSNLRLALSMLILSACLYVPGLIWFALLLVFVQYRHIVKIANKASPLSITVVLVSLLLLFSPLARALTTTPSLVLEWLAIPSLFEKFVFAKNFLYVPSSLVVRTQLDPVYNLVRLPLLDVITIMLVVLGSYAFFIRLDLVRSRMLIGAIFISWFLVALNNGVKINLFLPLIYLAVAGGIMFLLQQWYSVFPKNPLARTFGLILVFGLLTTSIIYNSTRYYIAWANNPVSRQSFYFQYNPPPKSDTMVE